ncbi:Sec-independent protein translocase protein TatB [Vibrio ulleungensis]|uniref:Sec-independent protein translocase protein TatB n=1 Tax=Vibrio ulleungensis TaxID=2807619 RepID=A0ABS2HJC3_9VIBR|nr:Sec-independent protein translocase protein TatB [Vibrio ulleungensis]MBM7037618.1 Sec-independent protein translocase subunit TatB [Vibrio ulleungensis]
MFDVGFWELILISILGLVVLGPERLPVAIRSVMKFINSAKSMANNVKDELNHELKVQEMHDNLKKAEKMGMEELDPELRRSVEELKAAAQSVTRPYADKSESSASSPASSSSETQSQSSTSAASQVKPDSAAKTD